MKYAIVGPMGRINRISDTQPKAVAEGATVVELTDEQAATVEAGKTSEPKVFYFLKEGELVTAEDFRKEQVAASPTTAEKHIEREGFPAIRLVTLMDLEGKLAEAGKTSAKLVAVRSWLDAVLGAFAANPEPSNQWPKAPFGFEETVQDAVGYLT
jgi:hypothetical protein